MSDRLTLSEAVEAVGKLIAAFPNGAPQNGKSYVGTLAAVLMDYPRTVALACADPIKGVSRETRFLPTVADLVAWCERETKALQAIVDRDDLDAKFARERRARAEDDARWQKARLDRPTYDELKAQHGPSWGLSAGDENLAAKNAHLERIAHANQTIFERECAAAGIDPAKGVSPALIKALQQRVAA